MIGVLTAEPRVFVREILAGIVDYAALHPRRWGGLLSIPRGLVPFGSLRRHPWTGLIAGVDTPELEAELREMAIPVVNVSARLPDPALHSVIHDNVNVGVLAADYFIARGYRHFAYVPEASDLAYLIDRGSGFVRQVAAAGYEVSWFGPYPHQLPEGVVRCGGSMTKWLQSLPKPVAIFTSQDDVAAEVHAAVTAVRLDVPAEVAILGVDNEPNAHFGMLGISSVEMPHRQIGHDAAALLDRLLDGETPEQRITRLPPRQIITRSSSDTLAVDDEAMLSAFKYIHAHACDGIDVSDVVRVVPVGRRTLERRYHKAFGVSPKHAIQNTRMMRARALLANTGLTVAEIAHACGFTDRVRFTLEFRKRVGATPSVYRRAAVAIP